MTRPILVLLFLMPAGAQQPFFTDDTDVTPPGKFHFEFRNEHDLLQHSAFPNLRQNTANFKLNTGLLHGLEIGIDSPLLAIFNAQGAQPLIPVGIGDTNFAAKYNFRKEKDGSRAPALAVEMNIEVPTGDTARQLGSGLADYWLNGILQKSLTDKIKLRVNSGILFSGNTLTGVVGLNTRGSVFTGGLSLVRSFTKNLAMGAEITGALTNNFELGKGQVQMLIGGKYGLKENFAFDFAVLSGRLEGSPRVGALIGFSVDF